MKHVLTFFKNIALFVTVLCTGALMAASLSPYLPPEYFWWVSVAGLGYIFLLTAVIFLLIFWMIVRVRLSIIPGIGLIFTIPILINYFSLGFDHNRPDDQSQGIEVMSYNVRNFDLYNWSEGMNTRINMFKLINDEEPAIACFQEFYTQEAKQYDNVKMLKEKVGFKYNHVLLNFKLKDNQSWGIATFTNHPIVDTGSITFPSKTKNACIFTDINVNGKIIRVYNVHLQSIRFNKKDYAYIADVEENKQLNPKSNRVILRKLRNAILKRAEQAEMIKKHMDASPYPVVVCGDFNDTPVSYAYHTMTGKLKDSFLESGWGIGYTYAGFLPVYRIDYILHDDNFIAYDYHTTRKKYSDHYPIMTKLQWKKPDAGAAIN